MTDINSLSSLSRINSVTFTGHRNINSSELSELRKRLRAAIIEHYMEGYKYFRTGMAIGFDMIAAEEVLSFRKTYPDIYLLAVIPFVGQDERWNKEHKRRYAQILKEAAWICLSDHFYKGCEKDRNTFMLNHSSRVIAYFDGIPRGGTYDTILKAEKMGMEITNIF